MSSESRFGKHVSNDLKELKNDQNDIINAKKKLYKHIHELFKDIRFYSDIHWNNFIRMKKSIEREISDYKVIERKGDSNSLRVKEGILKKLKQLIDERVSEIDSFIYRFEYSCEILGNQKIRSSSGNILAREKHNLGILKNNLNQVIIDPMKATSQGYTYTQIIYQMSGSLDSIKNLIGNECSSLQDALAIDVNSLIRKLHEDSLNYKDIS